MTKHEQDIWLVEEQLKSLERKNKAGYFEYALLLKKYATLTGKEWRHEANYPRDSA